MGVEAIDWGWDQRCLQGPNREHRAKMKLCRWVQRDELKVGKKSDGGRRDDSLNGADESTRSDEL